MAIRATKVGDPWPNHIERNIVEWWKIDDDAGGAVTGGTLVNIPTGGKVPIGVSGFSASYNSSTKILAVRAPAVATAESALITVIYQPGPP